MNTINPTRRLALSPLTVAALWITFAGPAVAQPRRSEGSLPAPAHREMRKLAGEVDARAREAADLTSHKKYPLYRRDRTFVIHVRNFAREAKQFNARLAGYREQPWPVDDELRGLLRAAREIQSRAGSSRYADDHTVAEWNDLVDLVDRMVRVSQSADGRIDFGGYPGPDPGAPQTPVHERDPRDRPPPPADPGRDEYGERRNPPGSRDSRGLAGRARDLEERAARAEELAGRRDDVNRPRQLQYFEAIRSFHGRVANFREGIESGGSDPSQVRTDADHLFEDARRLDNDMRRGNALPEVWPEWQGIVRAAQDIVNLVGRPR